MKKCLLYEFFNIIISVRKNDNLGDIQEDFIFEFGENTNVYGGCGAVLMDQMMYFGGTRDKEYQKLESKYPVCIATL